MRAGVLSGITLSDADVMNAWLLASPPLAGADQAPQRTAVKPRVVFAEGRRRYRVAALDLGIKSSTLRMMAEWGVETHVLPATGALDDVLAVDPDGVLLSSGPGDPVGLSGVVALTRRFLARRLPLFGTGFGHQILGLALGRRTYKMRHSHRGADIPVVDTARDRVAMTSQNHAFAVEGEPGERFSTPFGRAVVSHHCPSDGTVEGLRCLDTPAFSVQYDPGEAAGPHDELMLFGEFASLMSGAR